MPAGVRPDEPAARVRQVEVGEEPARVVARHTATEVVETPNHLEVLEPGQVVVDGRVLPREPDPLPKARGIADDVEPGDPGGARIGLEQSGQDPDRGCLACAVRAEQAIDGSRLHLEVDAVDGLDLAVLQSELASLDGDLAGHARTLAEQHSASFRSRRHLLKDTCPPASARRNS
jgi:hypothetical protein